MPHDPGRLAAACLSGELNRLARARFTRHLLDCPECWAETQAARSGRLLAESLREVAPAQLRDRLRAIPEALEPSPLTRPRGWPPFLITCGVAAIAIALTVLVWDGLQDQPAPLTAAAALYRTDGMAGTTKALPPARDIGAYHWQGTLTRNLSGIAATVHTYADHSGRRILVLASRTTFPRANGAHAIAPDPSWTAHVDGLALLCVDKNGTSWLTVAATQRDARAGAAAPPPTSTMPSRCCSASPTTRAAPRSPAT